MTFDNLELEFRILKICKFYEIQVIKKYNTVISNTANKNSDYLFKKINIKVK